MKIDENGDSEANYTIMGLSKSQPRDISEVGQFSYHTGDSIPVSVYWEGEWAIILH